MQVNFCQEAIPCHNDREDKSGGGVFVFTLEAFYPTTTTKTLARGFATVDSFSRASDRGKFARSQPVNARGRGFSDMTSF